MSKFYENLKNALNSKAYENSLCKAHLFDKRALQAFHLNLTPILKGDKFTKNHLEPFLRLFARTFCLMNSTQIQVYSIKFGVEFG